MCDALILLLGKCQIIWKAPLSLWCEPGVFNVVGRAWQKRGIFVGGNTGLERMKEQNKKRERRAFLKASIYCGCGLSRQGLPLVIGHLKSYQLLSEWVRFNKASWNAHQFFFCPTNPNTWAWENSCYGFKPTLEEPSGELIPKAYNTFYMTQILIS